MIGSCPLSRIYAIYPKNEDGKVWFHNLGRIITNNDLKYIIPINQDTGLIMISYLNGTAASRLNDKLLDGGSLKKIIKNDLDKLFPKLEIPDPTFIDENYWSVGTHYYKPDCDPNLVQDKINQPNINKPVWVIGESYSIYSGWIEGSLNSAYTAFLKIIEGL
jgi:monoamine oxidase